MEEQNYTQDDLNNFMSAMNGEVDQETKLQEQRKILSEALDLYRKQKEGTLAAVEMSKIKLLSIKHGNYRDYFLEIESKIENADEINDVDQFLDSIMQSK